MKYITMQSWLATLILTTAVFQPARAELRAGASVTDVTPTQFPVLVNGNMTSVTATKANTRLNARAIVLADGKEQIAIVVVDSCMMSREFLDDAKKMASEKTGIKPDRMLISATHTHSGAASMGCLGTDPDPNYVPHLKMKLTEAIKSAKANLEPAKVGYGKANAADYTAVRQWVIRPDRMIKDPFGNTTVRSNMHAGGNWDNATGEAGPEDPDLSLIAFQAMDGRPIAVLANFSMHYFSGVEPIHADYFGLFSDGLQNAIAKNESGKPGFVAMMSHGCSGDIWRRDYTVLADKQPNWKIDEYARGLIAIARGAYEKMQFQANADLSMAETRLHLNYRVPDAQRLEWSRKIVEKLAGKAPKSTEEVYAREQILLHEKQSTDIVCQAVRIGVIAIATTPTETYALTGLKLKLQSPLEKTMVIELANGGDGYIPPPEFHPLGGYNTWAARSAGLEVMAEPKIVAASLGLLEKVTGKSRKGYQQSRGQVAERILNQKPLAYWRMDEFSPGRAIDISGNHHDGQYEPGVLCFLEGPKSKEFNLNDETNRSAHFAGGRMTARVPGIAGDYTVSLWFWNGMPVEGRDVAGWIFARDYANGPGLSGDQVGLGGKATTPGRLIYQHGPDVAGRKPLVGRTEVQRWTWNELKLVKAGKKVSIYLNGIPEPEIEVQLTDAADGPQPDSFIFGGRADTKDSWEGRLDEIAIFGRAVPAK